MFFRWRRSLPTENACSPAPVMIATRTSVRTAIVSSTSVSRAPISVVIALSGGALSVITAMRPSPSYSSSTGSPASVDGGLKSSASQRSVRDVVPTVPSSSGVQFTEPAQRRQAGCEAVLAAFRGHERHQPLQAPADRTLRDREHAGRVPAPDERVALPRRADEDAVVEPLRLDELELTLEMGADEDEH